METTFGTSDFAIQSCKVSLFKRNLKKVERLFGVNIAVDLVTITNDSESQWLAISGNKENRENATRYIQAMCNSQQTTSVKVSGRPSLDDTVLEDIERSTAAFIERTGSLTLKIMGSEELYCTLAISQLEQTYHVDITGVETELVSEDGDEFRNRPHTKPSRSGTDLSPTEVMCGGVKELMVDSNLEESYASFTSVSRFPSPTNVDHNSPMKAAEKMKSSTVNNSKITKEMPSTELSADSQKLELTSLGLGMGYSQEEIDGILPRFRFSEKNIRPDEFLAALDEGRTNQKKVDDELPSTSKSQSPHRDSTVPSPQSPQTSGQRRKRKGKQGKKGGAANPVNSAAERTATEISEGATAISPLKNYKCVDNEVVCVSPESSPSKNDSVIFMGEERSNDSVCVVGPFPTFSTPAESQVHDWGGHASRNARKRKEYSDDEEQTMVLLPYAESGGSGGPSERQEPGRQRSHFTRDAVPFRFGNMQAPAVTAIGPETSHDSDLRYIVIDGSNVAMSHGNDKAFSCRGIQICVDHFLQRGHRVKVWVPRTKTYQNKSGRLPPILNQEILEKLKDQGYLGFTPARTFNAKHIVSHDDPFILELAAKEDAVVVSNDNFREFTREYGFIIENRVLSYVFSDDHFMLPRDPLGRYGPSLEQFLRKSPYNHNKQAANEMNALRPRFQNHQGFHPRHPPPKPHPFTQPGPSFGGPRFRGPQPAALVRPLAPAPAPVQLRQLAEPPTVHPSSNRMTPSNARHKDVTQQLLEALRTVFPDKEQESKIQEVLDNHCEETDLNKLTNYCISALNL